MTRRINDTNHCTKFKSDNFDKKKINCSIQLNDNEVAIFIYNIVVIKILNFLKKIVIKIGRISIISRLLSFCSAFVTKSSHFVLTLDRVINNKILNLLSIMCLVCVIGTIITSFLTNFDNSDEGYNIYMSINGSSEVASGTGAHIVGHFFGEMFNHKILGYRLTELILMLLMPIYLLFSIKKFAFNTIKTSFTVKLYAGSLTCILSCGFFIWMPSFDYNFMAVFTGVISAATVLLYCHYYQYNKKTSLFLLVLLAFTLVCSVVCKFSFGIPLIMMIIGIMLIFKSKINIKFIPFFIHVSILIIFFFGLFYLMFPVHSENFINILKFSFDPSSDNLGSHTIESLSSNYSLVIKRFIVKVVYKFILLWGIIFLLIRFFANSRHNGVNDLIKIIITLVMTIISLNHIPFLNLIPTRRLSSFYSIQMLGAAIIIAITLYLIGKYRARVFYKLTFVLLLCLITLMHPLGTGLNFMFASFLNLAFMGAIASMFIIVDTYKLRKNKLFAVIVLICSTFVITSNIAQSGILHYRRNAPYSGQTSYSEKSEFLSGIKIEENLANTIDSLIDTLIAINFDYDTDKIMAYCNMPGLLAATGARSFGESWMITGYSNSISRMIFHLKLEPIGKCDKIYILKDKNEDINLEVKKNLDNIILPYNSETHSYEIGKFYNYRNSLII